jgi:hypothetical protein
MVLQGVKTAESDDLEEHAGYKCEVPECAVDV